MKNAKLAIFASGTGSNAQKIIEYFKDHQVIKVGLICTNKSTSPVVGIAKENQLPILIFSREDFYSPNSVRGMLDDAQITHVVLAGFLWLIPPVFIDAYRGKMINIHPALLPKYGGKGMYGTHVHEAVKAANEPETGITIHLVNENYDEGTYLFQESVKLTGQESTAEIAEKVHQLEHKNYSSIIEKWIHDTP